MRVRFLDGPLVGEVREVGQVEGGHAVLIFPVLRSGSLIRTARYEVVGASARHLDPPGPDWEPGEALHRYGRGGTVRYMVELQGEEDAITAHLRYRPGYWCEGCDVGWDAPEGATEAPSCFVCGGRAERNRYAA